MGDPSARLIRSAIPLASRVASSPSGRVSTSKSGLLPERARSQARRVATSSPRYGTISQVRPVSSSSIGPSSTNRSGSSARVHRVPCGRVESWRRSSSSGRSGLFRLIENGSLSSMSHERRLSCPGVSTASSWFTHDGVSRIACPDGGRSGFEPRPPCGRRAPGSCGPRSDTGGWHAYRPRHHPVIGNQIHRQGRLLTRLNQAEGFLLQSAGGGIELFDPAQDLGIRGVRRKLALEKPLGVVTGTLTLVVVELGQLFGGGNSPAAGGAVEPEVLAEETLELDREI